jgi:hypothetical protein
MKQIKHLWLFVCLLAVTFIGMIVTLIKFLRKLVEFERLVRPWRSIIITMAVIGSLFFGIRFVSFAQYVYPKETAKDAQQDNHLENTDKRMDDMRREVDEKLTDIKVQQRETYLEGIEYTKLINQQMKDVTERVKWDEGIGFGLFTGIGVFQAIGVWKKDKPKKRHDDDEEE